MAKQLTIFKLGKHLPNYTDADLAATVAAYDPAVHEAPIVVGHPRTDSPAFGWIDSVAAVGEALMGTTKQVSTEFSEWVRQGYWKKRSASFYPPGHADHPLGTDSQVYYLKHVGYLGANPPKVKGMPDFEFCEDPEEDLLTIDFGENVALDFGEWVNRTNSGLWRRLREWIIATEGKEKADELVPSYEIESLLSETDNWEMNELRDRLKAIELKVFGASFAEQPREPKGTSQGGQFASTKGSKYANIPNIDKVEIQETGSFKETAPDILAEGGVIGEGQIEVNVFTDKTDPEDRADGLSDQYFFNLNRGTYKAIQDDPELLKAAIAMHADHVAEGFKDDFLDIPGTDYKLYSDPEIPELAGIYTKKEYDNFAEGETMTTKDELDKREAAIALRERATTLKEQELQFSEALDGVIKEGRVLAAEKAAHLKRLKMLAAIPADNVADFSEGKADYSPTTEYLDELRKRPVLVNFNEISGGEVPDNTSSNPTQQARAIDKRRAEAAKEGRVLSFAEADAELRAESNGGGK
jgi:hypothetical protein